MTQATESECLNNISTSVGELHRNLFLLINGGTIRTDAQVEAIQRSIEKLAEWEQDTMSNLQEALNSGQEKG